MMDDTTEIGILIRNPQKGDYAPLYDPAIKWQCTPDCRALLGVIAIDSPAPAYQAAAPPAVGEQCQDSPTRQLTGIAPQRPHQQAGLHQIRFNHLFKTSRCSDKTAAKVSTPTGPPAYFQRDSSGYRRSIWSRPIASTSRRPSASSATAAATQVWPPASTAEYHGPAAAAARPPAACHGPFRQSRQPHQLPNQAQASSPAFRIAISSPRS